MRIARSGRSEAANRFEWLFPLRRRWLRYLLAALPGSVAILYGLSYLLFTLAAWGLIPYPPISLR